jgi:hypothetical protein
VASCLESLSDLENGERRLEMLHAAREP